MEEALTPTCRVSAPGLANSAGRGKGALHPRPRPRPAGFPAGSGELRRYLSQLEQSPTSIAIQGALHGRHSGSPTAPRPVAQGQKRAAPGAQPLAPPAKQPRGGRGGAAAPQQAATNGLQEELELIDFEVGGPQLRQATMREGRAGLCWTAAGASSVPNAALVCICAGAACAGKRVGLQRLHVRCDGGTPWRAHSRAAPWGLLPPPARPAPIHLG